MKKIILLLIVSLLWSCNRDGSVLTTATPTRTGRVELASVCAQTTFMIDDSGIFGDRFGIYRSGRCEFVAYIEMEEIKVDIDPSSGNVTLHCPPIQIATPKYHFNELTTIYTVKGRLRDRMTQKEKHEFENKEVKQFQDSLMKSDAFTSKLKSKGRQSANILLPKLFKFNRELRPNVVFD